MAGPLEGIRVLDWTQWQMGTVATAMLGDLGATVIHIENRVGGDPGRALKTRGMPDLPQGKSAYFEVNNRGKKGIALDLVKEKGKEVIYRLAKDSDVFVHNFRQGVPERLKLNYETLRRYNPKIIYAAASGYGARGPDVAEPSFDPLAQARSGLADLVNPDEPPGQIGRGAAVADQMGAIMTGYGILAALFARERFGIGQRIDVSLLGSITALLGSAIGRMLYLGQAPPKSDRKTRPNPLWNNYKCKDDKWITLGNLQSDRQWPLVCKALAIEHLEKDPKYESADKRQDNCEELIAIMDEIFLTKSPSEWMKILKGTGDVICTPVQNISDLPNDAQVLANEYIIDYNHDIFGPVKVAGIPIQFSKTSGKVKAEAPELGQHVEEVLIEMGNYSWEEIARLKEEGVL